MPLESLSTQLITSLAGVGTRMVVADSAGLLSTQAIPGGSSGYTVVTRTVSVTETATTGTVIVKANTTTSFTITLPTAIGSTAMFVIKKTAAANTLTIATTLSQTIDGTTTIQLLALDVSVTLVSDNANWLII